jgi:hypothetical protein
LLYYALPAFSQKLEEEKILESPNEVKIFELEAVLQFTLEHFETVITKLKELQSSRMEFDNIWTLFPHHTLVYNSDGLGQGRAYRVLSSGYEENRDGSVFYSVTLDYLDSNGEQVGYVYSQSRSIPQFHGSMSIYDLPIFPLELLPNYPTIRQELITRGDKVLRLKGRHLQDYKGHALDEEGKKFNVSCITHPT